MAQKPSILQSVIFGVVAIAMIGLLFFASIFALGIALVAGIFLAFKKPKISAPPESFDAKIKSVDVEFTRVDDEQKIKD